MRYRAFLSYSPPTPIGALAENYRVPPRTFDCDPMVSNERNPPKAV